jgi:hypothetical protein
MAVREYRLRSANPGPADTLVFNAVPFRERKAKRNKAFRHIRKDRSLGFDCDAQSVAVIDRAASDQGAAKSSPRFAGSMAFH